MKLITNREPARDETSAGRRAARLPVLAIALSVAAVAAAVLAAGADAKPKPKIRAWAYRVVYEGSGTYENSDASTYDTGNASFHWKVTYRALPLSSSKKVFMYGVADPTQSSGGGTAAFCNSSGSMVLQGEQIGNPQPGHAQGTAAPNGSVTLTLTTGDPGFVPQGVDSGCGINGNVFQSWPTDRGVDPLEVHVFEPKSLIGKGKIVDNVGSASETLKFPDDIPPGLHWTGTVTLTRIGH
jgi:hypothetical protein